MKQIANTVMAGIACMLTFASCQIDLALSPQNEPATIDGLVEKSFTAPLTKTTLDASHHVLWKTTDRIGLFNGSDIYEFTTEDSGSSATFTGMIPDAASYYALYPYQATASCSAGVISATIPTEQTAVAGSFADGANVAVGVAQAGSITFKNVCGLVQLQITRDDIKSVKFESLGGESVSGEVAITVSETPSYTVSSGSTSATLTAEGDALAAGVYYLAVLPQTYSGFKLTLTNARGMTAVKSYANNLTIARAGGINLGSVDSDIVSKFSIDLSTISFADSFIYEAKDGSGNIVAIICKEFLNTANQQAVVVYGTKYNSAGTLRVMDSTNPIGLVARVLKSGDAGQYQTYTDVDESTTVHGGIFSFNSGVMDYTTPGSKTAISTVYATLNWDTGIATISDTIDGDVTATVLSPRTLVLSDRGEGKAYSLVKIGRQIWMAENLLTAKFNDGSDIEKAAKAAALASATGAMYVYVNSACYAYNGDVVLSGKLAPSGGWKVPTKSDAQTLNAYAGNMSYSMNFAQNNVTGFSSRYKGRVTSKWDNTLDAAYWCSNALDTSNKMQCFVIRDAGAAPTTAAQSYKYGFWVRFMRGLY